MTVIKILLAFSLSAGWLGSLNSDYFSLANPGPIQNEPDRVVYFYIDSGCTCQPEPDRPTSKYWIISDQVYRAKFNELDTYLPLFKQALRERFKGYEELAGSVVIRYQESEEEASKARKQKMEKMSKRGYTVIETKFNPPVRK